MPQMHFYVPKELAERIQQEAYAEHKSVSSFLADLVKREMAPGWPADFFEEVVGSWQGEPLQRAKQGVFDVRDPLLFGES